MEQHSAPPPWGWRPREEFCERVRCAVDSFLLSAVPACELLSKLSLLCKSLQNQGGRAAKPSASCASVAAARAELTLYTKARTYVQSHLLNHLQGNQCLYGQLVVFHKLLHGKVLSSKTVLRRAKSDAETQSMLACDDGRYMGE